MLLSEVHAKWLKPLFRGTYLLPSVKTAVTSGKGVTIPTGVASMPHLFMI
jgi:hypothetical protein